MRYLLVGLFLRDRTSLEWECDFFFLILQGDVRGNKDDFLLLTNDSAVFIYIEHPSQDKKQIHSQVIT